VTKQPGDRRYTRAHEWAKQEGDRTLVGITDYAQEQLGDVVYVGLPEAGTEVEAGSPLGEVESTKSVSDIYSPVSGTVVEKNAEVEQNPEIVNAEPYERGWLVAVETDANALDDLMTAEEYATYIAEEEA
jgi:glycine cleavage system H protein